MAVTVLTINSCKKDKNDDGGNSCDGQTSLTHGGQTYDLVEIGDQCWMAENLNYETGNSWCYDNNSSNCDTYGRLYDWSTALGACPSGWHIPSYAEWDIIVDYLGGSGVAGGKMKEAGTTHWNSPNTGATNSSGFTALPGGFRYNSGSFNYLGNRGYWWSSTEYGSSSAWFRGVYYNSDGVGRGSYDKDNEFSVRCLKD